MTIDRQPGGHTRGTASPTPVLALRPREAAAALGISERFALVHHRRPGQRHPARPASDARWSTRWPS